MIRTIFHEATSMKDLTTRRLIFAVLVVAFAVIDFFCIARIDPITSEGRAYGHQEFAKSWAGAPETESVSGHDRVAFNFRHFFKWWVVPRPAGQPGLIPILTSDGNGLVENLGAHLGGSTVLVFAGLWLSGSIPGVAAAATAMNVFHEYAAEGSYCDPSFVDLWLDQAGIFLAVMIYGMITSKIGRNRD